MNGVRLLTCVVLLSGAAALAHADDSETFLPNDAAWVRDAGDQLARCAGTYRGAAEVMRQSGREQAAAYAETVGSGALFAAYLLLTSPTAIDAEVLAHVDANVHIDALAWGAKRNFIMMDMQRETGLSDALGVCTAMSALQSQVLRGAVGATPAVAVADVDSVP